MKGEIGEKEKQGLTKQQLSQIEAQTAILETERKKEKAAAEGKDRGDYPISCVSTGLLILVTPFSFFENPRDRA